MNTSLIFIIYTTITKQFQNYHYWNIPIVNNNKYKFLTNIDNQINLTASQSQPGLKIVAMNGDHSIILKNNGSISLFGDNKYGQSDMLNLPNKNIVDISAGK